LFRNVSTWWVYLLSRSQPTMPAVPSPNSPQILTSEARLHLLLVISVLVVPSRVVPCGIRSRSFVLLGGLGSGMLAGVALCLGHFLKQGPKPRVALSDGRLGKQ
jgi:hypothetical protein